jgi:hypothetical protein
LPPTTKTGPWTVSGEMGQKACDLRKQPVRNCRRTGLDRFVRTGPGSAPPYRGAEPVSAVMELETSTSCFTAPQTEVVT